MTTPVEQLSFIPTNATTKRSLGDWTGDSFNVKNFGALGNGSDATAAFQAAAAAASTGGRIKVPRGSYQITAPISSYNGNGNTIIWEGDGPASSLFGTFNGFMFDCLSNPYNTNNPGVVFESL